MKLKGLFAALIGAMCLPQLAFANVSTYIVTVDQQLGQAEFIECTNAIRSLAVPDTAQVLTILGIVTADFTAESLPEVRALDCVQAVEKDQAAYIVEDGGEACDDDLQ